MNIKITPKFSNENAAMVIPLWGKGVYKLDFFKSQKANYDYLKKSLESFDAPVGSARRVVLPEAQDGVSSIILLGFGPQNKVDEKAIGLAFRRAIALAKSEKIKKLAVVLRDFETKSIKENTVAKLLGISSEMANYDFNKYKTPPKEGWPAVEEIEAFSRNKGASDALSEGKILGEEVNGARDMANTPGGDMTPALLGEHAISEGKKHGFKVRVMDEEEIRKLGMGGVMGVSRGSSERPKFIVAEYMKGKKSDKPIVFAGKGVTFDSGGLNLKPTSHIYEMHMDMSGGAAVIHAISAIARNKLEVNVVGLVPAVENMVSGSSYRPGDVLKAITGKTIEVLNTDAEGRVILADALGYASRYNPRLVVDVATLTGAAMVALGLRAIALFATSDKLASKISESGNRVGEPCWPLPMWDEYFDDIKGTFGDVANDGKNRYGGAIHGAVFLKQFIGDYPWVHLDIAPTMTTMEGQSLSKGASGSSVRLLYEIAKTYK